MSDEMKPDVQVNWDAYEDQLAEGKRNVKFGLGVGAVSAASLALIGTTCPLCFFVAPAMVGVGMWKSRQAKKELAKRDRGDDGTDGHVGDAQSMTS